MPNVQMPPPVVPFPWIGFGSSRSSSVTTGGDEYTAWSVPLNAATAPVTCDSPTYQTLVGLFGCRVVEL